MSNHRLVGLYPLYFQTLVLDTPCSCKKVVKDMGVKPKSRSTLCRSVVLSKVKRVMAALVNGGLGSTASMTAAPAPTRGVGAGTLMRCVCIACNNRSITWVKE